MYQKLERSLTQLQNLNDASLFTDSLLGLEKESLRVQIDGKISENPHPKKLGSALTHPYITTDYSEALLELITPPVLGVKKAMESLCNTHQFVYDTLDNEILWGTSMPCILTGEQSIPIANYGSSNPGQMKTIYRRGLAHRYGKMMQVIAGIHFNYSMSPAFWQQYKQIAKNTDSDKDFKDKQYLGKVRNIQRYGWLIAYLFGASPAICRSFIDGIAAGLEAYDEFTFYQPYATSLRLGDIGYQNYKEGKTGIKANYDSLKQYVESLTVAINTPYPDYEAIGVKVDDEYRQLNANILQIENEYYSSVRPKQIVDRDEKPSLALLRRGVEYIELRSLDINVFEPLGVNSDQLYFLEAYMVFCLLNDSPSIGDAERREIDHNQSTTAHQGRAPQLTLNRDGTAVELKSWALELSGKILMVAEVLDYFHTGKQYQNAVQKQIDAIHDPELTPSAKILSEMRVNNESFHTFSMRYSKQHHEYFKNREITKSLKQYYQHLANQSIESQDKAEQQTQIGFDEYLSRYFSQ